MSEYSAMDRILREERKYILDLCKAVQKSGCNVLLVQKSILRDATNGACSARRRQVEVQNECWGRGGACGTGGMLHWGAECVGADDAVPVRAVNPIQSCPRSLQYLANCNCSPPPQPTPPQPDPPTLPATRPPPRADLSLHFLAKMKILVVTDIERD